MRHVCSGQTMGAAQLSIQAAGKAGLERAGIYVVIREVRLKPRNNKIETVEWGREMGKGRQPETDLPTSQVSSSQPDTVNQSMYNR